MDKQFTPDLKLKAVNYYDKIKNYVKVCEIFECSERSLKRWVERKHKTDNVNVRMRVLMTKCLWHILNLALLEVPFKLLGGGLTPAILPFQDIFNACDF